MTIETQHQPTLEIGKESFVQLYPSTNVLKGKYLGRGQLGNANMHVFLSNRVERTYVLMDDHWTIQERGILTYSPVSSFSVRTITRQDFDKLEDSRKPQLAEILKAVGVEL